MDVQARSTRAHLEGHVVYAQDMEVQNHDQQVEE